MFEGAKWFKVVENVATSYWRMWNEIRVLDMVFWMYSGVNRHMGLSACRRREFVKEGSSFIFPNFYIKSGLNIGFSVIQALATRWQKLRNATAVEGLITDTTVPVNPIMLRDFIVVIGNRGGT